MDNNKINQQAFSYDLAWKMIQEASKITFLTHYNPDADGVSACAALAHVAVQKGKQIEAIYPTEPKLFIKRQPEVVLINEHKQIPDLIIICDSANYERVYYPEVFTQIPSINIDHHIIKPPITCYFIGFANSDLKFYPAAFRVNGFNPCFYGKIVSQTERPFVINKG
jgi:nanoRNase/pAp phosphatase (c-di-AMP/oligoRNAs hydrolase)